MTDVRRGAPPFVIDLSADARLRSSVERLMSDDYDVPGVMLSTRASDWPGDLAGRLLLSLSRYARAGAPTLERAVELNEAMLTALEERGYLGPEVGEIADEQQVACHGWVVAGLLQFFYVTNDERSRAAALRVLDELVLPIVGRFDYPWQREGQADVGEHSGTATQVVRGWSLSSDVWCVLLCLNGLVPAAVESGRDDLAAVIDRLVETVSGLDVVGQRAQLHAVLAAARNFADWALETGNSRAAAVSAALYDDYARAGRTLNYATYNWFARPDTWTEPCAVVDSLGVATSLHALTGDTRYRDDATRISRNGLDFAERKDGSFGLDSIATRDAPTLAPIEYDAHWCCTMRGAVGLIEARETAAHYSGGVLTVSDLYPGTHVIECEAGQWRIHQSTQFPLDPGVTFEVLAAPAGGELVVNVAIEEARASRILTGRSGERAAVTLAFAPVHDSVCGVEVTRIGPVLQVQLTDAAGTSRLALSEVSGTFERGSELRIALAADGRC